MPRKIGPTTPHGYFIHQRGAIITDHTLFTDENDHNPRLARVCPKCGGKPIIIVDYTGPDGRHVHGDGVCSRCRGLGVIDEPLKILHTPVAVYIGIVYAYLPFMILPLYTNLVKHDHRLIEAAFDLGCKPWQAFLRVTLPLSKAGIIAGSMLVLIPAVGEFVIPELMGGADTLMIGRQLWVEFFNNRDWPVASAVAIVMLVLLIVPIMIFHHYQQKELEGRLT